MPRLVPMTSTRSPFAKIDTSTWSPVFGVSPPAASFTSRRTRVAGTFAFLKCPCVGLFAFAGVSSTNPSCTASYPSPCAVFAWTTTHGPALITVAG